MAPPNSFLISFSIIYSKESENKMFKDNSKFEIQVNDISFRKDVLNYFSDSFYYLTIKVNVQ